MTPSRVFSPNKRRRAIKNEACVCTKAPREGAPPNDRGGRRRRRRLCGGGSEVFALAGNLSISSYHLSLLFLSCSSKKNRQGFTVEDETRKPIYTTHTQTYTRTHIHTQHACGHAKASLLPQAPPGETRTPEGRGFVFLMYIASHISAVRVYFIPFIIVYIIFIIFIYNMYNIIDLFFSRARCQQEFFGFVANNAIWGGGGGGGASARNVAEIWWNVRLPRVWCVSCVVCANVQQKSVCVWCVSCEFDFSVQGGGGEEGGGLK